MTIFCPIHGEIPEEQVHLSKYGRVCAVCIDGVDIARFEDFVLLNTPEEAQRKALELEGIQPYTESDIADLEHGESH